MFVCFTTAGVNIVSAVIVNNRTAVNISWSPLEMELSKVAMYIVYYTLVSEGSGQRQLESAEMNKTFDGNATHGLISDLEAGKTYKYQVAVIIEVDRITFFGERSSVHTIMLGIYNMVCVSVCMCVCVCVFLPQYHGNILMYCRGYWLIFVTQNE